MTVFLLTSFLCRLNSKSEKKSVFGGKTRMVSGVLRVARRGCGAKAPPLAARPEVGTTREGCRVVCLIQARLYQMIVRSVFSVSCPSCGAPLALT